MSVRKPEQYKWFKDDVAPYLRKMKTPQEVIDFVKKNNIPPEMLQSFAEDKHYKDKYKKAVTEEMVYGDRGRPKTHYEDRYKNNAFTRLQRFY